MIGGGGGENICDIAKLIFPIRMWMPLTGNYINMFSTLQLSVESS